VIPFPNVDIFAKMNAREFAEEITLIDAQYMQCITCNHLLEL
jgi:hypothetical protein